MTHYFSLFFLLFSITTGCLHPDNGTVQSHCRLQSLTPSANRGAIIAYYCNFNILYALWHYYSLLWRYYCNYCFANVQTIILHYCIISNKTIITIMAIQLFHLLFSAYTIAIIAIITLLFTLLLTHTIMTIMFFEKYYCKYCFPSLLL